MERIEALDDPRLDPYRDLKQASATRWNRPVIAEGRKVVSRLLESRLHVRSVLVADRLGEAGVGPADPAVPVWRMADELIDRLVGFRFHGGVLAHADRPRRPTPEGWLGSCGNADRIVGFTRVVDPENVGLIMRSCLAFGCRHLLIGSGSADPWSRRSLRLSMGAAFAISPYRTARFLDMLDLLRARGYRIVAADAGRGAGSLEGYAFAAKVVLLLGNESDGLEAPVLERCHDRVRIPISAAVDSLNVATAAGVMLYEWSRQRG